MKNDQTRTCANEERRKNIRYHLGVAVIFSWRDGRQAQHDGFGLTRDMSFGDAFVLTANPPPMGANVKLKGFFPPIEGVAVLWRIQGDGRVVRVKAKKHADASAGFAMVCKRFVLRRGEENR